MKTTATTNNLPGGQGVHCLQFWLCCLLCTTCLQMFWLASVGSAVESTLGHLLYLAGKKGRCMVGYTKTTTRAARMKRKARRGTTQQGVGSWIDFLIQIDADDYCIRRARNGKTLKGRCL